MLATAEPTEVVWTVVTLSGLFPQVMNMILQVRELRALRRHNVNGGAQFVARGLVIVEVVVMSIVTACTYIGIVAMLDTPDVNTVPARVTLLRLSILWSLFYVGIAISIRSWTIFIIHRYRPVHAKAIMEIIEEDNRGESHE